MTYATGDTVVHPQHGTATVGGMVRKDVGRGPEEYLELYIEAGSMKVMVPAHAVEAVGIRSLSTKAEAEAILATLSEPSDVPETWQERNTATVARMKSRDLDQMCLVVRDLSRHQEREGKPLTLGESAILKSCLDILTTELALVLEMSQEDTRALILDRAVGEGHSAA